MPYYGPASLVEKWAYFFREAKNLDVVPPTLSEGPFREALEVARAANFTTSEWDAYERSKMAEQDARGALSLARTEAKSEGKAEGKAEAVLVVLKTRGINVSDAERAQMVGCPDQGMHDDWLRRAALAVTTADLFG